VVGRGKYEIFWLRQNDDVRAGQNVGVGERQKLGSW